MLASPSSQVLSAFWSSREEGSNVYYCQTGANYIMSGRSKIYRLCDLLENIYFLHHYSNNNFSISAEHFPQSFLDTVHALIGCFFA